MQSGKGKIAGNKRRPSDHPSMRGVWIFAATALIATATIAAMRLAPETPGLTTNIQQAVKPYASSPLQPTPDVPQSWQEIPVRYGDTLGTLLDSRGLYGSTVKAAIQSNVKAQDLIELTPGKTLRYRLDKENQLLELVYARNPTESIHLFKGDDGRYRIDVETRDMQTRYAFVTGTIDQSLFISGQEAGLSDPLIMRLTEIFGWDIDFATSLRKGDTFSVIHEEKYWLGQKIADGPILAAEFVNQGKVYRAIGIPDHQQRLQYFTPEGRSVRRPFLRTPVHYSRISSRYGARKHPISKRWSSHFGVDYAAPTGTPIRATSSGRVIFRGRKGGYGNAIILQHGGDLSTLYGHMSRFRPGISLGSYIEQGQIIGYVGQTGLATGPHLHYELRKHGHHQNPLTYPFPKATTMAEDQRTEFQTLLTQWSPRLDLMTGSRVQLARNP